MFHTKFTVIASFGSIFTKFMFTHISGILNNSRSDRRTSKHLINPLTKEAHHENFPVHHKFFQLPEDECEKKIKQRFYSQRALQGYIFCSDPFANICDMKN